MLRAVPDDERGPGRTGRRGGLAAGAVRAMVGRVAIIVPTAGRVAGTAIVLAGLYRGGVAVVVDRWQWTIDSFLRAEDAGLFGDRRVQLVNGEVSVVVRGSWPGRVCANVDLALGLAYEHTPWRTTHETLLLANDAPDPDCWVVRRGATPVQRLGRVARYHPADIGLVVDVSDSSAIDDLSVMAAMYAAKGYRDRHLTTDDVAMPHVDARINVADILLTD